MGFVATVKGTTKQASRMQGAKPWYRDDAKQKKHNASKQTVRRSTLSVLGEDDLRRLGCGNSGAIINGR